MVQSFTHNTLQNLVRHVFIYKKTLNSHPIASSIFSDCMGLKFMKLHQGSSRKQKQNGTGNVLDG